MARAAAEQALSWAENDDTGAAKGGLKIVVVENMFRPSDFEVSCAIANARVASCRVNFYRFASSAFKGALALNSQGILS